MTKNDDMRGLWENSAIPFATFVESVEKNQGLWQGVYRTAQIPSWALESACATGSGVSLLVIAEDWCGDAANSVPVLARLGEVSDCLEMRIISRDQHPAVMDRYLTNGSSRSIPIVIALDEQLRELGHWGPRPAELQAWVMENKGAMASKDLHKEVSRWYATDRGETVLSEVLGLLRG